MTKLFASLTFLVAFCTLSHAQDSLKIGSTFSFETKGSGIFINDRSRIDCITCIYETIQDNPIHHFAIYSGLSHKLSLNDKYTIETGVFLEERSFSGGDNTVDNWIVYPKIFLSGENTMKAFNRTFRYKIAGGDFWNEDFDDMLRIHNIDFQGIVTEVGYKNTTLGFLIAGDLSVNIGLGLHQYHKFYVKQTFNKLETNFYLSDNQLANYQNHILPRDINFGNNTSFKISDRIQVEGQLEFRANQELGTSLAAGIGAKSQFKNLRVASNLKYYQADFNLGYYSTRLFYRGNSSYVGEQLYPLRNFFRYYSQWGNYTRIQNKDLVGFELQINWEQNLHKRMAFFTDIDLNIIGDPETQTGRTVPLYTAGLRINYFKHFKTEFFITNKHMNLDSFYQTFQASELPYLGGSVVLDLKGLSL